MRRRERDVAGRVPVLRDDDVLERRRELVDDRHDLLAVFDRQRAAGDEAVLHVDDEQRALRIGLDRRGGERRGAMPSSPGRARQAHEVDELPAVHVVHGGSSVVMLLRPAAPMHRSCRVASDATAARRTSQSRLTRKPPTRACGRGAGRHADHQQHLVRPRRIGDAHLDRVEMAAHVGGDAVVDAGCRSTCRPGRSWSSTARSRASPRAGRACRSRRARARARRARARRPGRPARPCRSPGSASAPPSAATRRVAISRPSGLSASIIGWMSST